VRDNALKCTPRAFGIATAANWGFDFIVRKLLAGDSTLANAVDQHTSPLIEAALGGHARVVQLLIETGADPSFQDAAGKTALEVAEQRGHAEVAALLRGTST
jgi:ankyrin repeat protein